MYPRGLERMYDLDQCDGRNPQGGGRCHFEAEHGGPHSFEAEDRAARDVMSVPLEEGVKRTRDAIHRDREEAKAGEEQPGRGMPVYPVVMNEFFQAMCSEMESNFYKGDPEPYRECDAATTMGEIFYHVLKLAWLVKNKPDDIEAMAEFTADVANCAFIAFANLKAKLGEESSPTLIESIGDPDEFQFAFDEMTEWIAKHFGWSREEMCFGRSD